MIDRAPESMRFGVVREPMGYSVIDKWLKRADRRVAYYTGKTARARAWADARKREREAMKESPDVISDPDQPLPYQAEGDDLREHLIGHAMANGLDRLRAERWADQLWADQPEGGA